MWRDPTLKNLSKGIKYTDMKNLFLFKLLSTAVLLGMSFAPSFGQLDVTAPANVAGWYLTGWAGFGTQIEGFSGELVQAIDINGLTTACATIDNSVNDVTGKVALIDRGSCYFADKSMRAQTAGAIGVVICNTSTQPPDQVFWMFGDTTCNITIPVVSISYNDCQKLKAETGVMVEFNVEQGETFEDPIVIAPGNFTVAGITSNEGILDYGRSVFYKYLATTTDTLHVKSCGGGTDTWLSIVQTHGNCRAELISNFIVIDESIDDCDDGNGNIVASETHTPITEGQEYYIIWNHEQSSEGFDFNVSLSTPPATSSSILASGISLYPNPVLDKVVIRVDLPEASNDLNIHLLNVLGERVFSKGLGKLLDGNVEIDLGGLPAGIYLLHITDGGTQITRSIVKQ